MARVTPSVIGRDHLIVADTSGSSSRYYIVQLLEHGGQNIVAMKARLYTRYNSTCDAYEVLVSAAEGGYGPLLYDAVMENLYPKWLTPDRKTVSPDASRVWKHYFDQRSDVEHAENEGDCPDSTNQPWLNYLYRKKSGKLSGLTVDVADLGNHPKVVEHMGAPVSFSRLETDVWDYTPHVRVAGW
jgi:hypothetical protein